MPQRPTDASRWLEPDHRQDMLDFYAKPSAMTSGGAYAAMFDPLPRDVAALSRVVQGLAIHEYAASPFYGVAIPEERRQESHIRPVERMVQHVRQRCGEDPVRYMTGGAGWKMAPHMSMSFELVESLIFDGLLVIGQGRFGA